jgi:hypothetical protein
MAAALRVCRFVSTMKRSATQAALTMVAIKKRVHFADNKQYHDNEQSCQVLDFDSIIDFRVTGFIAVRASVDMQGVAATTVNIIGEFLSFVMTGDDSRIPLAFGSNMNSWKRVKQKGIHDYVPLHFHPFILKHITLSLDNYYSIGQLTGHSHMHTMMEGCVVRPQGSTCSSIMIGSDDNIISPVVHSMYVVSIANTPKNGGPEFLAHWVMYRRLINVLLCPSSGFQPKQQMFHHSKRVTHQYSERDIALINAFISIYTTYTHAPTAERLDVINNLYKTTLYKELIPFAVNTHTEYAFVVPITLHMVTWIQPKIRDGTWLYYDQRAPMRWRSNTSKYPFIAIETSLYHMRNGRLGQTDVIRRLNEFSRIQICPRRYKSTADTGDEQKWAASFGYKLDHDACHRMEYNRPSLGYARSRMLGVDPLTNREVRWT